MRTLHARITTAWNTLPVFLQASMLLGVTAYFLLHLGQSVGQALYYLTH
ncbi:hypothetical protein [Janthinobacterium sp. RT4P48]